MTCSQSTKTRGELFCGNTIFMTTQGVKKEVCGEFPEFCYRAFECKEYARQFIDSGRFRMGCLLSYRESEDKSRRDPTEGRGHTVEPGIVTVGLFSPNPAQKPIWMREQGYQEHHILEAGNAKFCFCTCLPEARPAHIVTAFGKYIIKISDPRQLAEDINDYFFSKGQGFLIVGCEVVYNKGQKLARVLGDNERLDLAYKQKPFEEFHRDCEFRIVAINLGQGCPDECKYVSGQSQQVEPRCSFIELNLGKRLDYASFANLK